MEEKNKKRLAYFFGVVIIVLLYLVATDYRAIKSIVGYNVPSVTIRDGEPAEFLRVPPGFTISRVASDLDRPRVMVFDEQGRLFVSETKAGNVIRLDDVDEDGVYEKRTEILSNRDNPHGLAFYTDPKGITYLYVAETEEVRRFIYDNVSGTLSDTEGENIANLPPAGRHFTRTIAFGPNLRTEPAITGSIGRVTIVPEKLYISVGSSCDVCDEDHWKYSSLLDSDPDGTFTAQVAIGLRNSVFFVFHPDRDEIWATEMGRDNLGDNLPPDEINIINGAGDEYGWPNCYGDNVTDTEFNKGDVACREPGVKGSHWDIPAHSAPLGLTFMNNSEWPAQYSDSLFVAYHGSWNRSEPTGYKVVFMQMDERGEIKGEADFIAGWLSDDKKEVYGRPVDLKFGPNGNLYITDDAAGAIYMLRYDG